MWGLITFCLIAWGIWHVFFNVNKKGTAYKLGRRLGSDIRRYADKD